MTPTAVGHSPAPNENEPTRDERGRRIVKYFICYASDDITLVEDLRRRLEIELRPSAAYAFRRFMDRHSIELGAKWHQEILQALGKADLGLLFLSPNFLGSPYVQQIELPTLIEQQTSLAPILLQEVDFQLQATGGLDARSIFALQSPEAGPQRHAYESLDSDRDRNRFARELFRSIESSLRDRPAYRPLDRVLAPGMDAEAKSTSISSSPAKRVERPVRLWPSAALRELDRVKDHLAPVVMGQLRTVVELLDEESFQAPIDRTVAALFADHPEHGRRARLDDLAKKVTEASSACRSQLALLISDQRCWLEGIARADVAVQQATEGALANDPAAVRDLHSQAYVTTGRQLEERARRKASDDGAATAVNIVLWYAPEDTAAAKDFKDHLSAILTGTTISFCVKCRDDIPVGVDKRACALRFFNDAELIVPLVSPSLLNPAPDLDQAIFRLSELEPFRAKMRPVDLWTVLPRLHNLGMLAELERFTFSGRPYAEHVVDDPSGRAFCTAFVKTVFSPYAAAPPRPHGTPADASPSRGRSYDHGSDDRDFEVAPSASRHPPFEDLFHDPHLGDREYVPTRVVSVGFRRAEEVIENIRRDTQGVDAVDALVTWALDPKERPYCAVLGEYGIGKTTTLKQFARRLHELRRNNPDAPQPIFIDLRYTSDIVRAGRTPDGRTVLTEAMAAAWPNAPQPHPTADDVLYLVRNEGAVLIFDGLDEKLVHLDGEQGNAFIRGLWSCHPAWDAERRTARTSDGAVGDEEPRRPGRIVFSCRSHYFKSIDQQNAAFTGGHREGVRADDYRAFIMLPFNRDQIRRYLKALFGGDDARADQAIKLIGAIHNLTDLAERPYLLSLIAEQIGDLESKRVRGEQVNAASLYAEMTKEWLTRDKGKHKLSDDDKHLLMEDLAADMWRSGDREWPWSEVDHPDRPAMTTVRRWFLDRIRGRFDGFSSEVLEEDFRTATFVLRPDDSLDRFRFAHTSLQEYFLARYMERRLLSGQQDELSNLPSPSQETLAFLGQSLSLREAVPKRAAQTSLGRLLHLGGHVAAWVLQYWVHARPSEHPEPMPDSSRPPNFSHLRLDTIALKGRSAGLPIDLTGADFTEASLRGAIFRHVRLSSATLAGADCTDAEFDHVVADNLYLDHHTSLASTVWRHCFMKGMRGTEHARWQNAVLIHAIGADLLAWNADANLRPRTFDLLTRATTGARRLIERHVGHTDTVLALQFMPQAVPGADLLASAGFDGFVRIWEVDSGRLVRVFQGHAGPICALAKDLSPDLQVTRLASGGSDGSLRLWDLPTGRPHHTFRAHVGGIRALASFRCPGLEHTRIASAGNDGAIRVWDMETGRLTADIRHRTPGVTALAAGALPNCGLSLLAAGFADGQISIMDPISGAAFRIIEGHSSRITSLALGSLPTGTYVIVSTGDDGVVRVSEVLSGRVLWHNATPDNRLAAAATVEHGPLTADAVAVVGYDRTVRLHELSTGRLFRTLTGHGTNPELRVCRYNRLKDSLRLFSRNRTYDFTVDPHDSSLFASLDSQLFGVCCLALWVDESRDSLIVASAGADRQILLWDTRSGHRIRSLGKYSQEVLSLVFMEGKDGNAIHAVCAGSDGRVLSIDPSNGRIIQSHEGLQHPVTGLFASRLGETSQCLIAAGGYDDLLFVWRPGVRSPIRSLQNHGIPIFGIGCGCDCKSRDVILLAADGVGSINAWHVSNGRTAWTRTFANSRILGVAFSSERSDSGPIAAVATDDEQVQVLRLETGESLFSLHTGAIAASSLSIAAHPRTRTLYLTCRSPDGALRLWDLDTQQQVPSLTAESGKTRSATLLPSTDAHDLLLIAVNEDALLEVWSVAHKARIAKALLPDACAYHAIALHADASGFSRLLLGSISNNQLRFTSLVIPQKSTDHVGRPSCSCDGKGCSTDPEATTRQVPRGCVACASPRRLSWEVICCIREPDSSYSFDPNTGNLLWAEPEAWRSFEWEVEDPATKQMRYYPAEYFGPLPVDPDRLDEYLARPLPTTEGKHTTSAD